MTVDEAIKVKEKYKDSYTSLQCPEEKEADRLSIEALKRIKYLQGIALYRTDTILPGETKE